VRRLKIYDVSGYLYSVENIAPYSTYSYYGFALGGVKFFMKYLAEDLSTNHGVIVCFDSRPSKIIPGYKSNRTMNVNVIAQMEYLQEALEKSGVFCARMPGKSADSLIATYTKLARESGEFDQIIIMSDDMDIAHNVWGCVRKEAITTNGCDIDEQNYSYATVNGSYVYLGTISAYKTIFGCKSDTVPSFHGSVSNTDMYRYFVNVCEKYVSNRPDIASSREFFNAAMKDCPNLEAEDYTRLMAQADLVFPEIIAGVEWDRSSIVDIEKANMAVLLSIVKDNLSLKKLKLNPVKLGEEHINFFKENANIVKNGEFKVDRNLPFESVGGVSSSVFDIATVRDF
jgi:hypothetical protein